MVSCAVNFVPCLLEQIKDYQSDSARDPVLEALIKPAAELSTEEISRLRFFPTVATDPSPDHLQEKSAEFLFAFSTPEKREKSELLNLRQEIFFWPLRLFSAPQPEKSSRLTVSPYYHPLLPLWLISLVKLVSKHLICLTLSTGKTPAGSSDLENTL